MSHPRYRWWQFALNMVRDYPKLKAEYEELHRQSTTATLSGVPGSSEVSRGTENTALKELRPDDQKVYEAVNMAVELTRQRKDGHERLELIRYVYWTGKKGRLDHGAVKLFISDTTARRWHGDFIRLVGSCYGFEVDDAKWTRWGRKRLP